MLKKRRDDVLQWKTDYEQALQRYDFNNYVNKGIVVGGPLAHHDKESKFFWALQTAAMPDMNTPGWTVVQQLLKNQLNWITQKNALMLNVTSILDSTVHDDFHNFRKMLRAVVTAAKMFTNSVFKDSEIKESLNTLDTVRSKYGDLNDVYTKYSYMLEKFGNQSKEAVAAAQNVEAGWQELVQWEKTVDVNGVCNDLISKMINYDRFIVELY